jgi:hypothetical protein
MSSRSGILAALLFGLAACGPSTTKTPPSDLGRGRPPLKSGKAWTKNEDPAPPSVPSHLVVSVPAKTVGPFVAFRGSARMAAYIAPTEAGIRRVVSVPLAPNGEPREARVVAPSAPDATILVVRGAGGDKRGFVLAWTALTDRGEALFVSGVGEDGVPAGAPLEVARTNDDIVWVELIPTPRGSVCVWAEETRAGGANLSVVALEPDGKLRGVPSRIARDVIGWQAVPTTAGVGLAFVASAPDPKAKPKDNAAQDAHRPSMLSWMKLDADGRPVAAAVAVASSPGKIADFDVTRIGAAFVFAWTERSALDPEVKLAWVDSEGKPRASRAATERSGGASLVALEGGAAGGVLLWEESTRRGRSSRRLHLWRLDASGVLDPSVRTVLEIEGAGVPEVVAAQSGYALLVRARACAEPPGKLDPPCDLAPAIPMFLRFDDKLRVMFADPIRLDEEHEPAAVAWGLGCEGDACLALAATGDATVAVRSVELGARPPRYRAPVVAAPVSDVPHLASVATLAAGDAFGELGVARLRDGALVATITSALDDSGKKGPAAAATVTVRALDATGEPRAPAAVITTRALSVGGVGIAPGPPGVDGGALAWVARDEGDPEVHVTRVDRTGHRLKDVRLTMTKGDASDVAIAAVPGGWIVAWVDTRDGNGEVYASKVDTELQRVARDERITDAPGDAGDVALLAATEKGPVWLAWADPRESPHDGFADIFVAGLSPDTARAKVSESRVLATAAHSRSPVLALGSGDGPSVAWIEEAPMGIDASNTGAYGAMIAELDGDGRTRGAPVRTRGAGEGFPTSVSIDRSGAPLGPLRVVLARSARDELTVDAVDVSSGVPHPSTLLALDGPPSLDVSLALSGDVLFFNDDGPFVGDGRVRRALLSWPAGGRPRP